METTGQNAIEFATFPKIPRLIRSCIVTEKIDGTNAQIFIADDGVTMKVGSRNRWITPDDDNYGFAKWVEANRDELLKLGPGRHYGEWWGAGIQRRYGLNEKRFSLFNTSRWMRDEANLPKCCHVVPVLGHFDFARFDLLDNLMYSLRESGSVAAPGFNKPEGIVVYHTASKMMFKRTFENDATGKEAA